MANVKITDLTAGTTLVGTELFEAVQSAGSVKLSSDQIKFFCNEDPTLVIGDNATNTPSTAVVLQHTSSAVVAPGIGVRLDFECQTASSNNEIGARIEAVATNVTSGTEAFDLIIKLMTGGALPTEAAKLTSAGVLSITGDRVIVADTHTPASANDPGTAGTICWDSNYIYVCIATDTWKRVGIGTW